MPPTKRGGPAITDRATPEETKRRLSTDQPDATAPGPHGALIAAQHAADLSESLVSGVLELDLDDLLSDWPRIPRGVTALRIRVGRSWVDMSALIRLANIAHLAGVPVEVVGTHAPTLADALWTLDRRFRECRQADAAFEAQAGW